MDELKTVNCEQLMTTPLKPTELCAQGMISAELFILAGAPKIGKGSATNLVSELKNQYEVEIPSNKITQNLVQHGIELKNFGVTFQIKRSCGQRFIILNYDRKSDSSDGCHLWVEIAVTAVTSYLSNALPMRINESDDSFESDGTVPK